MGMGEGGSRSDNLEIARSLKEKRDPFLKWIRLIVKGWIQIRMVKFQYNTFTKELTI